MLRYREIPTHTTELLDLTSLTMDEFAVLVPPFEAAFLDYMALWTLHGRRQQARAIPPMQTVLCRPRKIVSYLFWSTSSSIPFICSMDACSACANPKRLNGFTSCSRCCGTPYGP